jgi:site-specific recombinase XerD
MTALAPHLTAYLREHLPRERAVSPYTVKTYANCFVLLVRFAADRLKRRPTDLEVEDLGIDLILAFLDHIEAQRGSSVRTRNGRLAAIRSFFRYIEYRVPVCLDQALQVRSIPSKKTDKALIDYLDRAEIKALLDAPDPRTRLGTRDRAMLHLAYAGGLRVSELVTLQLRDFPDRSLSTVHIMGKGRRERVLPLWKETQFALRAWLAIRPGAEVAEIFLNANGQPMTRDGFAFRLAEHVKTAAEKQPSILGKRVTPHVLRHSCAMHTLAATGDIRKVALWLGHASIQSTEAYLRADPDEKLQILAAHGAPAIKPGRFKPPSDALITMLTDVRRRA